MFHVMYNHSYIQSLAAHLAKARVTQAENHWSTEQIYAAKTVGIKYYYKNTLRRAYDV